MEKLDIFLGENLQCNIICERGANAIVIRTALTMDFQKKEKN
jgi:hypothetical protein